MPTIGGIHHGIDGDYVRCAACQSRVPVGQLRNPLPVDGSAAWWPDEAFRLNGYADWHAGDCAWILRHRWPEDAR